MPLFQNAVLNTYLSGIDEAEWLDYFTQQKAQADELKTQIAQTDSEIEGMVYELYGVGEEEVGVVEKTRTNFIPPIWSKHIKYLTSSSVRWDYCRSLEVSHRTLPCRQAPGPGEQQRDLARYVTRGCNPLSGGVAKRTVPVKPRDVNNSPQSHNPNTSAGLQLAYLLSAGSQFRMQLMQKVVHRFPVFSGSFLSIPECA